jgi:hypothetical protein
MSKPSKMSNFLGQNRLLRAYSVAFWPAVSEAGNSLSFVQEKLNKNMAL